MTDSTDAEPAVALPSGIGKLSLTVAMALGNMTPQERDIFDHEYGKRRQGVAAVVVLAVLFPIHPAPTPSEAIRRLAPRGHHPI